MRFLQSVSRKGVGKQQYKEAPPWLRRSGFYSAFLKLEWALNIEYATSQGQKRKDDFGYILIIEYHMGGETSNRNQLGYTSLVSYIIPRVYLLKFHKNIRWKNIIKVLGLVATSDSRSLSLTTTPNPIIIFIILIIIFHLFVKIFIFL